MANNSQLSEIPRLELGKCYDYLQTGDILFCSGEDEVSQMISWATDSIWTHVGIVFQVESLGRTLILESVESQGVRLFPLSRYVHDFEEEKYFEGRIVIGRYQGLEEEQIKQLMNFGFDEITQPFDKAEITRIMRRIIKGEGKPIRDKAYICSELIYECFLSAGIEIPYNSKGFISPADIWGFEKVEPILEIITH